MLMHRVNNARARGVARKTLIGNWGGGGEVAEVGVAFI